MKYYNPFKPHIISYDDKFAIRIPFKGFLCANKNIDAITDGQDFFNAYTFNTIEEAKERLKIYKGIQKPKSKHIAEMKNSTFFLRLLALIAFIILCFLSIVETLITCFSFYFIICVSELIADAKDYSNKYTTYGIIPRKYNIIAIIIDWVDSFPPIIKKK